MVEDGLIVHQTRRKLSMNRRKRNRNGLRSLLFLVGTLTACSPDAPDEQRNQRSVVDVILTVSNGSRRAAQVSLASDKEQRLLGDVASGASQSFSVPSALVGSEPLLRLTAIGDGGMLVRSESFAVRRGDKVEWKFADTGRGVLRSQ